MKKIFYMLVLMVGFASAQNSYAHGALAIDSNQGDQYGFAYNYPTSAQAQNKALSECGYGCRIVETFSRGCAAYAADQAYGSTVYGWSNASNSAQAQNMALQYCRNQGGTQCIVRVWGCSQN